MNKSGTIVLTGWMEGNDIVLLISDDGVGITPEKSRLFCPAAGTVLPEEQTLQFTIRTVVFRFCTDQTTDLLIPASPAAAQKSKYEYLGKKGDRLKSDLLFEYEYV